MSIISEFYTKQTTFNTSLSASLAGIEGDITSLNDKITQLQNSPGAVTPEDQALIDDLTAQGEALSAKFDTLNQLTPPKAPTA